VTRLTSAVLAGALMRKAQTEGGFAAVLAKGDATAGSILVILTERGANPRVYERILQRDGRYIWQDNGIQPVEETGKTSDVQSFVARRRRFDQDLWVLELDIPSAERFAAEMNNVG
jgi:hypothetical protein